MIFKLTAKNCRISKASQKIIGRFLNKVTRALSSLSSDQIVLRFTIRKNIDMYYPLKKAYQKPSKASFEGSISFRLNKNRFYTHFKGTTINECARVGFERILREIDRFRNLHFVSDSDYPGRQSIRGFSKC